jgi:8-amino-7-oxononanoate synthase
MTRSCSLTRHAVGVAGDRGQGLTASPGLSGADHVTVTVTLSKSLAALSGGVLGHTNGS